MTQDQIPPLTPLSFEEGLAIGHAMHDRWCSQADDPPPLTRDDCGWGDLARTAFEKLREMRAASVDTRPQDEAPVCAGSSLASGAVPNEDSADAQTGVTP